MYTIIICTQRSQEIRQRLALLYPGEHVQLDALSDMMWMAVKVSMDWHEHPNVLARDRAVCHCDQGPGDAVPDQAEQASISLVCLMQTVLESAVPGDIKSLPSHQHASY
eukprot:252973-Amphidinium_carterae.1